MIAPSRERTSRCAPPATGGTGGLDDTGDPGGAVDGGVLGTTGGGSLASAGAGALLPAAAGTAALLAAGAAAVVWRRRTSGRP